jgi:hypothetical protein
MGIEAFAEAALSLLPGWHIASIENVDFSLPLKFYRHEPRSVTTNVKFSATSGEVIADCALISTRSLPGKLEPQTTKHFNGKVRLANGSSLPTAPTRALVAPVEPVVDTKAIYQVFFHGPAYQVIARAWRDGERMIGQMATSLPPNHIPADLQTVLDPRLIELCLQTAGLWEISVRGSLGLPQHIDQINFWHNPPQRNEALCAIVTPNEKRGDFHIEVLDSNGNLFCEVLGYRTVTLVSEVDASPLKWLQAVAA